MTNKETRKRAKKTGKQGEIKTCKGREKIGKGYKKTGMGCNHRQGGFRKYRQWCVKRQQGDSISRRRQDMVGV
jgi:hypothetical protein